MCQAHITYVSNVSAPFDVTISDCASVTKSWTKPH